MPNPENERAALPVHVAEQYEAGYSARFREEAFSLGATRSWQAGWTDANRELGKFEEAFSPAQSYLPFFGTGDEARRRELPFDPSCDAPGTGKRSIIVHHRVPGKSELKLMISLCPGCHAKIYRTRAVLVTMPPLLLKLWREQHPGGMNKQHSVFESAPLCLGLVDCFSCDRSFL